VLRRNTKQSENESENEYETNAVGMALIPLWHFFLGGALPKSRKIVTQRREENFRRQQHSFTGRSLFIAKPEL